jgi:protein-S-isoprenylcysteine O-methyltransferase Ste14
LAQAILLAAVLLAGVRFRGKSQNPFLLLTGTLLIALGVVLILAGAIALGRNLTPYPKPAEKAQLLRSGIFSFIRHPVYTGVMLMSFGWAQIWQSKPALVMAFALIPFFIAKARREEHWLRKRFAEYHAYERRVRRFIPRFSDRFAGLVLSRAVEARQIGRN